MLYGIRLSLRLHHQRRVRGDEIGDSIVIALSCSLCGHYLLVGRTKITVATIEAGNDGDQILLLHGVEKMSLWGF